MPSLTCKPFYLDPLYRLPSNPQIAHRLRFEGLQRPVQRVPVFNVPYRNMHSTSYTIYLRTYTLRFLSSGAPQQSH